MGSLTAVVTVSDGVANGTREDTSGALAHELLDAAGFSVASRLVVPDERTEIEAALSDLAAGHALVVTTGGTGFGPRDVTPEATRALLDREAPGLAELMRAEGLAHTPMASLSRAVAGTRGTCLILNLPGSPAGVREGLDAVMGVLPHAVELVAGTTGEHPTGHTAGAPVTRTAAAPPGTVTVTAVKQIGSPPCPVGARMVAGADGPIEGTLGCAEFDTAAMRAAAEALTSGVGPHTQVFHHDLGDIEVFVEPHPAPPLLVACAATPVAVELLRFGRALGYRTALVESRPARIEAPHRDAADQVVGDLGDLEIDSDSAIVHTDHDAPGVVEALAAALRGPAGYVGVMGSRRHVGPHVEALRGLGFDDDDVRRVRSPVGIDLGGTSPAEIAISIAAGLVAVRTGRVGGWLDAGD